jgi:hypothetical protein
MLCYLNFFGCDIFTLEGCKVMLLYNKILTIDLTLDESITIGTELVDWVMENIKGKYRVFYITIPNYFNKMYHCPSVIWIYDSCDAMMFKLRWC